MIGILNAYYFDSSINNPKGIYNRLINEFTQKTFAGEEIRDYKIAFGEWPENIDECRVWIITGSAKGAYDQDPWIAQLKNFIRELDRKQKKLIGICFGHQVIAEALGGHVEKSSKGWGLGAYDFEIVNKPSWMPLDKNRISLLFSHQDQVIQLPPNAQLIGSNEFCPNQMYQIGNHILTVQGHPEYNIDYAKEKLNKFREQISKERYLSAMESFEKSLDSQVFTDLFRTFADT